MPDHAVLQLTFIMESITAIRQYVVGIDHAAFLRDPILKDALAMRLQVIGEAARRLSHSDRNEAPEIPWAQIVSFRNRIAHDYRSTDFEIVWHIVTNELDLLYAAASRMLSARGEQLP